MSPTDAREDDDGCCASSKKRKPNLLFIVCDQMRWDALRHVQDKFYGKTREKIQTPNIDALMRQGVEFTEAYWCVQRSYAFVPRSIIESLRIVLPEEVY